MLILNQMQAQNEVSRRRLYLQIPHNNLIQHI